MHDSFYDAKLSFKANVNFFSGYFHNDCNKSRPVFSKHVLNIFKVMPSRPNFIMSLKVIHNSSEEKYSLFDEIGPKTPEIPMLNSIKT